MNVNLSTIDLLSAIPARPAQGISSRGASRADGCDTFGLGGGQIDFATEGANANELGKQSSAASLVCNEDAQQSDTSSAATQLGNRGPLINGFEDILKLQLNPDDSSCEQSLQVGTQYAIRNTHDAKAGTNDKAEQVQLVTGIPGLQIVIVAAGEQSQPNGEPVSSQPVQCVRTQTDSQPQTAVPEGLVAAEANQGQDVSSSVLQQNQATAGTAQNTLVSDQATPLTFAMETSVPQGNEQPVVSEAELGQIASSREALPGADSGQTSENTAVLPSFVDDAGSVDAPANIADPAPVLESGRQAHPSDLAGQNRYGASVQTRVQLESLSVETVTGGGDVSRVLESAVANGQPAGLEVAYRDRVEDGPDSNRQGGSRQLTGDRPDVDGPAEKLNIGKVELFSENNSSLGPDTLDGQKSDLPDKSDSGNGAPQFVRGQMMAFSTGEVVAGNRAIAADHNATAAKNGSLPDTAAAIREQIYQSLQTSVQQGSRQITVHLNPPELGRVSVKFSEQGNELTGLLEATNPQTRAEIRQAVPEIIRSLEELGVSIKRLDVVLSDLSDKSNLPRQSAQQSLRDNSSQDLLWQSGQHGFQDAGGNRPSHDSFVAPAYLGNTAGASRETSLGSHQSSSSDNLLDVLI